MAKSQINYDHQAQDYQQDHSEMENFTDDDDDVELISDDSEDDPLYTNELVKAQSSFSKLSINRKSKLRDEESQVDDEGMGSQKLDKEAMKDFEQVRKMIDCGQVEKLKVEQCKVYLRKYGLRLTGKKDILIQRIKEHMEILNGGEKKYPPSSFVMNCKGDACLGDIVMFEQTVYEGYSIVSRSANGPPCGKRTIAGRIVNESYGAAKQQHTFTVEVLWSKGEKPLPPLHPLLIKGRNLYKLDTRRQKWEDEAERRRVLSEKHDRGTVARSNREARIQEKVGKKPLKGVSRANSKNKENICHQKDLKLATEKDGHNFQQLVQSGAQYRYPPSRLDKPHMPASRFHQVPTSQVNRISTLSHGYQGHVEYRGNPLLPVSRPPTYQQKGSPEKDGHNFQQQVQSGAQYRYPPTRLDKPDMPASHLHQVPTSQVNRISTTSHGYQGHVQYRGNPLLPVSRPPAYQQKGSKFHCDQENLATSSWGNFPFSATFQNPERTVVGANYKNPTGPWQRPSQRQQLCPYYPRGRCHFGNQCKFMHE